MDEAMCESCTSTQGPWEWFDDGGPREVRLCADAFGCQMRRRDMDEVRRLSRLRRWARTGSAR
jgi:hypothetical protein